MRYVLMNNADILFAERECIKIGMIARPAIETFRVAVSLYSAHDIAVRIKDTNFRHVNDRQSLLTAGFAYQGGW